MDFASPWAAMTTPAICAICSVCNEGASNPTLNRPEAIKLIAQVRRAPVKDQLDVLDWLMKKFPGHNPIA
jgi:hypothetical protein